MDIVSHYETILTTFKKYGTIKHIKLEKLKAVLEFVERDAIQNVFDNKPILILGKVVTLSATKEKGKIFIAKII